MPPSVDKHQKRRSNPLDEHVGVRLRIRRVVLKMSQERLGKEVGITFQQIQKYENGSNRISAGRLFEFARILDVPIAYFFEDLPVKPNPSRAKGRLRSDPVKFLHSRESIELNQAFECIKSQSVRQRIVDLVKELSKNKD